jgi:hypothetical protein
MNIMDITVDIPENTQASIELKIPECIPTGQARIQVIITPLLHSNDDNDNSLPLKSTYPTCPPRGVTANSSSTVDEFLAMSHKEKEME